MAPPADPAGTTPVPASTPAGEPSEPVPETTGDPGAPVASPLKMSVIIPVYNPGAYIEDCIGSLLRQSMPPEEFEAIFVDDGSTDESPARLDALAAEYPHMKVIHQENSGWSGKPRNVGIDAALGEFVFFVDNDDWLGNEALERLYAFAKQNDSDIVIGKMAGMRRGVPRELFRKTYSKATLENAPLIDSLTPHKVFRKAFLDEHKLRFPEGRRRLEDHVFVIAAYFAADTISVLSDYVCYYHIRRDDQGNAGFIRVEPRKYFQNLCEALDIVEENTTPGPLRDRLYRRWYRNEMVERLRGSRLLRTPTRERNELLEEVGRIAAERFGPGVAAGLPSTQRVIGSLAKAGRLDDLLSLAYWESEIAAHASLGAICWHEGALQLTLTADLRADGEPITFVQRDKRDLLDLPMLSAEGRGVLPDSDLDSTDRLAQSRVDVLARSRDNGEEHYLAAKSSVRRSPIADDGERFQVLLDTQATIDVTTASGGSALPDGIWDVVVRIVSCGWRKDVRLGAVRSAGVDGSCVSAVLGDPARVVTPYWTDMGNLSLDIGQQTSRLRHELSTPAAPEVGGEGSADLTIKLPLAVAVLHPVHDAALRLVHDKSGKAVTVPARLTPAATGPKDTSVLCAELHEELDPGRWSVEVRLVGPDDGKFIRLPVAATASADGRAPAFDVARDAAANGADASSMKLLHRGRAKAGPIRRGRWLPVRVRWALIRALRRARR